MNTSQGDRERESRSETDSPHGRLIRQKAHLKTSAFQSWFFATVIFLPGHASTSNGRQKSKSTPSNKKWRRRERKKTSSWSTNERISGEKKFVNPNEDNKRHFQVRIKKPRIIWLTKWQKIFCYRFFIGRWKLDSKPGSRSLISSPANRFRQEAGSFRSATQEKQPTSTKNGQVFMHRGLVASLKIIFQYCN